VREYKITTSSRIYITIFCLLISIGGFFFLIFNTSASLFQRLIVSLGILFFMGGSSALFTLKIGLDEQKVILFDIFDMRPLFLGKRIQRMDLSLNWDEIGELHTTYVLFPETADVILKPKKGINKKQIGFLVGVGGMPIELLKDILINLPPDTKIYLYPYLKRKLEGKQTLFYRR